MTAKNEPTAKRGPAGKQGPAGEQGPTGKRGPAGKAGESAPASEPAVVVVRKLDQKELIRRFTYHKPKGDQEARYTEIRDRAKGIAEVLNSYCPPSRELSLAMTSLEEAVMWANAAIARNE